MKLFGPTTGPSGEDRKCQLGGHSQRKSHSMGILLLGPGILPPTICVFVCSPPGSVGGATQKSNANGPVERRPTNDWNDHETSSSRNSQQRQLH